MIDIDDINSEAAEALQRQRMGAQVNAQAGVAGVVVAACAALGFAVIYCAAGLLP